MGMFAAVGCAFLCAVAVASCAGRPAGGDGRRDGDTPELPTLPPAPWEKESDSGQLAPGSAGARLNAGTGELRKTLDFPDLTKEQLDAVTPVVESFAAALAEMAPEYPELAEYEKDKATWRAADAMGVSYVHNFKDPGARRRIEPRDFGEHGCYVRFRCATIPPPDGPVPTMIVPDHELAGLGLYVWTHAGASPNASPELLEKVNELLESHADRLVETDRKAQP